MKFKGIPASNGTAKGQGLVIQDLAKLPPIPEGDYIIVAPYTTPAMNVIIFSAKGIVCETGGLTTHAAIIARELYIPCVMSVVDVTKLIPNGQQIELDADIGEVVVV